MMSPQCYDGCKGFALITTVIALTLMGLMVSGLFFLSLTEQRQGRGAVAIEQAFRASEAGAARALALIEPGAPGTGEVGGTVPGGEYNVSAVSLGSRFVLLKSVGFSDEGNARQETGVLVEFRTPALDVWKAALTVVEIESGRGPMVSGIDAREAWPECSIESMDVAGLRTAGDSLTLIRSCEDCFLGVPGLVSDSTVAGLLDSLDFGFFRATADRMLLGASVGLVGPRVDSRGACDLNNQRNWGDPRPGARACGSFIPVVYSATDLEISGGEGQGILVVDGDLTISGGFEFAGIVMVRGDLTVGETGATLIGAVTARSARFPQSSGISGPYVVFSTCALDRVLKAHRKPAPIEQRFWVDFN